MPPFMTEISSSRHPPHFHPDAGNEQPRLTRISITSMKDQPFSRRCADSSMCHQPEEMKITQCSEEVQYPSTQEQKSVVRQGNVTSQTDNNRSLYTVSRRLVSTVAKSLQRGKRSRVHADGEMTAKKKTMPNRVSHGEFPPHALFSNKKKNSLVEKPDVSDHDTWYYSSNHVLVNRERIMRGRRPLIRNISLDEMARSIAAHCAETGQCKGIPSYYNGNIIRGLSIRSIHERTMKLNCLERSNILSDSFREFGMGTSLAKDGTLYLCQLFLPSRLEI